MHRLKRLEGGWGDGGLCFEPVLVVVVAVAVAGGAGAGGGGVGAVRGGKLKE